ncbi:GNAT family N-acetyltransferase [Sphingomonas sp. Mn802worker]|uniref:GNAT family N-acetyltransferase n=1 Tax=Sphingomonas sp. Mn802worker TaxID=629773 RepID=UPI00035F3957|nr:GNAT family N-acetyltransferase [Sphingomonas sp. Mn802worker]
MDWDETETLVTRTGFRFFLRPVTHRDEETLAALFRQVSAEDLRFRFLSGERGSSEERFTELLSDPAARATSFLAFDERRDVIASATLRGDTAGEHCEVAIMIRAGSKGRGVGWTLLDYLVGYAINAGYATMLSIEDRDNHESIMLQRQMGFATEPVDDEPTLVRVRRRLR